MTAEKDTVSVNIELARDLYDYFERHECDPDIGQPETPEEAIPRILEVWRDGQLGKYDDVPIDDPTGYEAKTLWVPIVCEMWFKAQVQAGRIPKDMGYDDFLSGLIIEGLRRRDPAFKTPGRFDWESGIDS